MSYPSEEFLKPRIRKAEREKKKTYKIYDFFIRVSQASETSPLKLSATSCGQIKCQRQKNDTGRFKTWTLSPRRKP